eukprot:TRINITY_DN12819_c0_g1_i1.p1 TRINITY_DN12819_c0_g1~~TRINITY_DN12819_c0_g1_i1.p1  ORF type:complete len:533 (+),score=68.84 TRINITY_DN12819_c0_g1_i1:94-1692(+)
MCIRDRAYTRSSTGEPAFYSLTTNGGAAQGHIGHTQIRDHENRAVTGRRVTTEIGETVITAPMVWDSVRWLVYPDPPVMTEVGDTLDGLLQYVLLGWNTGFLASHANASGIADVYGMVAAGYGGRYSFGSYLDGTWTKDTYLYFEDLFDHLSIVTQPSHSGNLTVGQDISGMPQVLLRSRYPVVCAALQNWRVVASLVPSNSGVFLQTDLAGSSRYSLQYEGVSSYTNFSGPDCACMHSTAGCTDADKGTDVVVGWTRLRVTAVSASSASNVCFRVLFDFSRKGYGVGRTGTIVYASPLLNVVSTNQICLTKDINPMSATLISPPSSLIPPNTEFPDKITIRIRSIGNSNKYLASGTFFLAVVPTNLNYFAYNGHLDPVTGWRASQIVLKRNWCWYVDRLPAAGSCPPFPLPDPAKTADGEYNSFTVAFSALQLQNGKNGQSATFGVFTSAQLHDKFSVNDVTPRPLVQTTAVSLQSTPSNVAVTTAPPTTIQVGKAFTVVCRVTSGAAPLARQLVHLNMSTNTLGLSLIHI